MMHNNEMSFVVPTLTVTVWRYGVKAAVWRKSVYSDRDLNTDATNQYGHWPPAAVSGTGSWPNNARPLACGLVGSWVRR